METNGRTEIQVDDDIVLRKLGRQITRDTVKDGSGCAPVLCKHLAVRWSLDGCWYRSRSARPEPDLDELRLSFHGVPEQMQLNVSIGLNGY